VTPLLPHIVPAIEGFFRSIALSSGNSLQDTLRLLTLWFKYGHTEVPSLLSPPQIIVILFLQLIFEFQWNQEVNVAITAGFRDVSIDTWLQVIPQIIARIHTPSSNIRRLILQLLCDVGKVHPQALIYPLTVASKSQSDIRSSSAMEILNVMRKHSPNLVEQVLI